MKQYEFKEFKPFSIKAIPSLRFWEDEDSNLEVRGDREVEVNERQFRSRELRRNLLSNKLLITKGSCEFVSGSNVMKVSKGKDGENKIKVVWGTELDVPKQEEEPTDQPDNDPDENEDEQLENDKKESDEDVVFEPDPVEKIDDEFPEEFSDNVPLEDGNLEESPKK